MKTIITTYTAIMALALTLDAFASDFSTKVPMRNGGAATFYISAQAGNLDAMDFMVDTGSGYMTINEETLYALQSAEQAEFKRMLQGVLANGSEITVPVYQVKHFNIGGGCLLKDVEAAVFPGKTRQIIGLNALKQAGPFIFSFDPPNLILSNCTSTGRAAQVGHEIITQAKQAISGHAAANSNTVVN
jgi:predicted aspartyl protease